MKRIAISIAFLLTMGTLIPQPHFLRNGLSAVPQEVQVHGQTAKFDGGKPVSTARILIVAAWVVLLIAVVALLATMYGK